MNQAQDTAQRLAAAGAIIQLPGDPPLNLLVGAFSWLPGNRIFWFTANGDSEFDGHVLEFDEADGLAGGGVAFYQAGQLIAYLTSIADADSEDPAAYAADWAAWKKIAPSRAAFIAEVKANLSSVP